MRVNDLAFWAIPVVIAGVAGVLGYRALRTEGPSTPESAPDSAPEPVSLTCPAGVFRCTNGAISATTGEENPGGETPCLTRSVARCADRCVADGIPLVGVSDETAKVQLCDPPADLSPLVGRELSASDLTSDAGESCVADGYGPSEDGVLECILQSAKDPDALGVVVSRITCRTGVVVTLDPTPRIVSREQAIALWCRRDGAVIADAPLPSDASPPIDAPAPSDASAPLDAADAPR